MNDAPQAFTLRKVIVAMANEGIPVCAIARVVNAPSSEIYEALHEAKDIGAIADIPRPDWPPGTRVVDRLPSVSLPTDDDLAFLCKQTFKLTGLEAAFLVSMLKHRKVEKNQLHNIVEQKRMTRGSQPNDRDATDPKMVDVMICKLRKKLKLVDKDLRIETIWGGGYFIGSDMKPRIIAHVNGEPNAPPQEAAPAADLTNGNPIAAIASAARAAGPTHY